MLPTYAGEHKNLTDASAALHGVEEVPFNA